MTVETEAVYKAMLDARALLDSGEGRRRAGPSGERCIAFRLADELYAIELLAVREVIVPPEIVPVPGASREVLGVINVRGSVVTVINSRAVLGLDGCAEGPRARVLVLDQGGGSVGALVDAVEDIFQLDADRLEAVPRATPQGAPVHVRAALTVRDEGGAEQIAFLMGAAALVGAG